MYKGIVWNCVHTFFNIFFQKSYDEVLILSYMYCDFKNIFWLLTFGAKVWGWFFRLNPDLGILDGQIWSQNTNFRRLRLRAVMGNFFFTPFTHGEGRCTPPPPFFCLLLKIGNPYLKILDLANLFVAVPLMDKRVNYGLI